MSINNPLYDIDLRMTILTNENCLFIQCCLQMDPALRWNCQQLLEHPYMDANRDAFDPPNPRPNRKKNPSRTSTHVSETVRCHPKR